MKESTIVTQIIKMLRKEFVGFYYQNHGGYFASVGLPDISGCYKGLYIGVEVKTPNAYNMPNNNATVMQRVTIDKINNYQGIAFITYSVPHARGQMLLLTEGKNV